MTSGDTGGDDAPAGDRGPDTVRWVPDWATEGAHRPMPPRPPLRSVPFFGVPLTSEPMADASEPPAQPPVQSTQPPMPP
ncbi:hypothetical protein, partial [Pseudonocardia autotrophica]|uniref:hypothetical protein n=1 Tax=Pseudonocardia autotrophica TaxID=2074 RepID=UPI001B80E738